MFDLAYPELMKIKTLIIIFCTMLAALACKQPSRSNLDTNPRKQRLLKETLTRLEDAPEFSIKDLAGNIVSLQNLRGKVVMLNFWATWCAPCVFEMPSLERLYQTHKARGLEIVAINIDPPKIESEVKAFAKLNGLSFKILLDQEISTPPLYGVGGFPETIFVSREGKILPFKDPQEGKESLRVLSDRPWDSPEYIQAVEELL